MPSPKSASELMKEFEDNFFAVENRDLLFPSFNDWLRAALKAYGEWLIEEGEADDKDSPFRRMAIDDYAANMRELNEKV